MSDQPIPGEQNYQHLETFANRNPWHAFDPQSPTEILFDGASINEVRMRIDNFQPSAIIVEGVALSAILKLAKELGIATILDMHNIESSLYAESRLQRPLRKRIQSFFSSTPKLSVPQSIDRRMSCLANATSVCSESDQHLLKKLGGASARTIPNPVPDTSLFDIPISLERYNNPTPVFIGHLSYFPNVAAVQELTKPVKNSKPRAKLVAAGRAPDRKMLRWARKEKLTLLANPPSTHGLLGNHGYTLLPIRHGSGTRIKVVEAMAAGVVVIGSEKAVEGLGLCDGRHYLQCQTVEQMWDAQKQLTQQPEMATEIAQNARQYAKDTFHPKQLEKQVAELLRECLATPGRP